MMSGDDIFGLVSLNPLILSFDTEKEVISMMAAWDFVILPF